MLFKRLKMTNSYRSTDSRSEKKDKQRANRKLRRITKVITEDYIEPLKEEIADVWDWVKDGMHLNKNKNSKDKINRMKNR